MSNSINNSVKYCEDCRFAEKPKSSIGEYHCKNPKLPVETDSPISRVKRTQWPCSTVRCSEFWRSMDQPMCGKEGAWFEK